jgi:hypothetical protein
MCQNQAPPKRRYCTTLKTAANIHTHRHENFKFHQKTFHPCFRNCWNQRLWTVKPLRWVHTCNVTAYRNAVSWQCGRDSWPRNVSKVGYAVTLRACSVLCRYLAVASKGWYGYGLSRYGRATWHVTTVRSSRLLYIHNASGSRNKMGTPCCNARRILLRHEARDESSDRNFVSCQLL